MTESAETLGMLHLSVERKHERAAALEHFADRSWTPVPDWRLHRHIVRVALYLAERAGVQPGDRVLLAAPISVEWIVIDWACVIQGAMVVVASSDASSSTLRRAIERFNPRVAFVGGDARDEVDGAGLLPREHLVCVGGEPSQHTSLSEVLDLGGTLDTAERANALRDRARALRPDSPAVAHVDGAGVQRPALSHGQVVARWRARAVHAPPRSGDLAYLFPGSLGLDAHVALYGLTADGVTCTIVGRPGLAAQDMAARAPRWVLSQVVRQRSNGRPDPARQLNGRTGAWGLLDRVARALQPRLEDHDEQQRS